MGAEYIQRQGFSASRTREIAFIGLTVALMSVSAWVSISFGPVPFTLQTFVAVFALLVLKPSSCMTAIAAYLVLGAIGLPVFSSMRGGVGVLMGATGGFLWGFLLGAAAALFVSTQLSASLAKCCTQVSRARFQFLHFSLEIVVAFVFILVTYLCGWAQLMAVAAMTAFEAFATGIAPFIVIDIFKCVAACMCARAVKAALNL